MFNYLLSTVESKMFCMVSYLLYMTKGVLYGLLSTVDNQ